jgi:hypothetical protein
MTGTQQPRVRANFASKKTFDKHKESHGSMASVTSDTPGEWIPALLIIAIALDQFIWFISSGVNLGFFRLFILFVVIGTVFCVPQGQSLLKFASSALRHRWSIFKSKFSAEIAPHYPLLLKTFCVLLVGLFTECFCITAVIALDRNRTKPAVLQDNFRDLLRSIAETYPVARTVLTADVFPSSEVTLLSAIILACLGLFGLVQGPVAGAATQFMCTLGTTRILRTFHFMSLILPSAVPECYYSRRYDFVNIHQGSLAKLLLTFKPGGGCNDLLFSGHATMYTLGAVTWTRYPPSKGKTRVIAFMWITLVLHFLQTIYSGHHYSVDMTLGFVVTMFLWQLYEPIAMFPYRELLPYERSNLFWVLLTHFITLGACLLSGFLAAIYGNWDFQSD